MKKLYDLIRIKNGKTEVMMTDTLPCVNDRLDTLRASRRGKKETYQVNPSQNTQKYKKPPATMWKNYDAKGIRVPIVKKP